jgi:ABC-type methionine transport system ATPase subunit
LFLTANRSFRVENRDFRCICTSPAGHAEESGRHGCDLSGRQHRVAIARALTNRSNMAILLVEQHFAFARDLAAADFVMQRGEVVVWGRCENIDEAMARGYLTV